MIQLGSFRVYYLYSGKRQFQIFFDVVWIFEPYMLCSDKWTRFWVQSDQEYNLHVPAVSRNATFFHLFTI